jgi:hypothetical protein
LHDKGTHANQRLTRLAGAAVAERLLSSAAFGSSSRVALYVSCERLREVNTHSLLFRSGAPCVRLLVRPRTRNGAPAEHTRAA